MSKENVEKLLTDGWTDKALRAKYNVIETKEGFVASANADGYAFTIEELDAGLSELASTLGHTESGSCSLEDSNEASDKPGGVPSSGAMMEVLKKSPELLKEICYMYAQDFICFDYDLPEECEGLF